MTSISSFYYDSSDSSDTTVSPSAGDTITPTTPASPAKVRSINPFTALRHWLVRHNLMPSIPHFYRLSHLRQWMQLAHYDALDLSYRTNIPQLQIYLLERGFPCTVWTLGRVAEVLGVASSQLRAAPGALEKWGPLLHREATRHVASHRYPSTQVLVVPTMRIQASEVDGELRVYMPCLWFHTPCDENGIGDVDGELAPEVVKIMEATGLELEPALQIVYCEVPAPLATAQKIATALDVPLSWLIDF